MLLRGVDRAAFAVAFVARLRRAGQGAGITETDDLVRALEASPPINRDALYWTARVALVRRQADLVTFERVFASVFDEVVSLPLNRSAGSSGGKDEVNVPVPGAGGESADGGGLPWATLPPVVDAGEPGDDGPLLPELRPSALGALADRPFEELDAAQTRALGDALRAALTRWPHRAGRRYAADDHLDGQPSVLRSGVDRTEPR